MNSKTLLYILVFCGLGIVAGYRIHKDGPVYHCDGSVGCDLDDYVSQKEWDARQGEIEAFRWCGALTVQQESEDLKHLYERVDWSKPNNCVIYKKSPQPVLGEDGYSIPAAATKNGAMFTGGYFISHNGGPDKKK